MGYLKYFAKKIEYFLKVLMSCIVSDKSYHEAKLRKIVYYEPDLENPVSLNEKICHRLIFDRNALHTTLTDRLAVRTYISNHNKNLKFPKLIGVYKHSKEVDFDLLPKSFVLKCSHGSGEEIVCTDKNNFDVNEAKRCLDLSLKINMYYITREWQYRNISPMILCEEYLELDAGRRSDIFTGMLKMHCFHGDVSFIEVGLTDLDGNNYINVYDCDWELLPFIIEYPNSPFEIPKPRLLKDALISARELTRNIEYCRMDVIHGVGDIYFNNISLSPCKGKLILFPAGWDFVLGKKWIMTPYK